MRRARWSWGRALVPFSFVLLVLALLGPSLVGDRILTTGDGVMFSAPFSAHRPAALHRVSNALDGDEVLTFQPQLLKTRQELGRGELGLWTADVGAGRPLLASQQQAPLFPLTWLAFLLPFWSAFGWIAAGRLLIAATGTYRFCRDLGHGRGPAAVGAISFAFGTYMITWLTHPHANVYALLPWLFVLVRRTCRAPTVTTGLALAAVVGLAVLGGHPESCAIALAAAAAFAAFELVGRQAGRAAAARLLAGALVAGLLLGAVMIIPLAELLGVASRSARGVPPSPLYDLFPFAFPELAGRPDKAFSGGGPVNFQERTAYIGVLPALLAVAGLVVRRGRTELFLTVLAALSLLLVIDNPLARGVRQLPGVEAVDLGRLLVLVSFAGAVLAAAALETAIRGSPAQRRRLLRTMGILGAVPAVGALAGVVVLGRTDLLTHWSQALQQLPALHPSQADKSIIAVGAVWRWLLVAGIATGALWLAWHRGASRRVVSVLAVVVVSLDLVTMDHGYRPVVPRAWALPPVPASLRWAREHVSSQRVSGAGDVLPPDLPSRFGLRSGGAYDLPYPARYNDLVDSLVPTGSSIKRFDPFAPRARLFAALFGVRFVIVAPGARLPGWLAIAHEDGSARVAVDPEAAPRAWVVHRWRPASGRLDALRQTALSSPRQVVRDPVIEGAGASAPAGASPEPAKIVRERDEDLTIEARPQHAGYLMLDDSIYPGWEATLDGHAVPIRPANENFRAVPLPAGRHTVTFRYRPAPVFVGAAISGVTALGLALAGLLLTVRRWRSGASRRNALSPVDR